MYLSKARKTKWTVEEDNALRVAVSQFPYRKGSFAVDWKAVSKVSGRTTKQCRERWINVLDPSIRRDQWTSEEIRSLFEAQEELGNKWAAIALRLPGRPETAVKNTFYAAVRREQRRSWAVKHGQPVPDPFHPAVPQIASVRRLLASMGETMVLDPSLFGLESYPGSPVMPPSPAASIGSRKRTSAGVTPCVGSPAACASEETSLLVSEVMSGDGRPRKFSVVCAEDEDVFDGLESLALSRNKTTSMDDADSESFMSDTEHEVSSPTPAASSGVCACGQFDFPLMDPLDLPFGMKLEPLVEGCPPPDHTMDLDDMSTFQSCFDLADDDFAWLHQQ